MRCEDCNGTGEADNHGRDCPTCNGTGEMCDYCGEPVDVCDGLCDGAARASGEFEDEDGEDDF